MSRLVWRMEGRATQPTDLLVLALHGMGMDQDVFADLLSGLFTLPAHIVIPKAPLVATGVRRQGASWYDYDGNQPRFRAELERTERLLLQFLTSLEQERELKPRARVLLGFSQGGYCGSYVALRNADVFNGMVISGARVKVEILESEIRRAAEHDFKALLCHGKRDRAVTPDAAESSRAGLAAGGVDVELRQFDAGHSMGGPQVEAIAGWLQPFLQRASRS